MTSLKIVSADEQAVSNFLASCGSSLNSFRYFSRRPLSVIQNHLVCLLGLDEEESVAYGHLDPEEGVVWLGVCVAEAHLGKGYGTLMMQALLAEAIRLNVARVQLSVDVENTRAIRLYERLGFRQTHIVGNTFFYEWINPESF